jgi:hypothetical protein
VRIRRRAEVEAAFGGRHDQLRVRLLGNVGELGAQ